MNRYLYVVLLVLTFCQVSAAKQTINVGTSANDGTGDTLRGAFIKVNDNFTELYNEHTGVVDFGDTGTITNVAALGVDGISYFGASPSAQVRVGYNPTPPGGYTGQGLWALNAGKMWLKGYGDVYASASGKIVFTEGGALGFAAFAGGTADTLLYRDDAGTLAQRNGANAQTSRIYGSYTDASNFSRISLSHDGSGTGTIAVETAGTGADDQSLALKVAGNGALYVEGDTAGNARGNNAVDLQIGRSAATEVASGLNAVLLGGYGGTASGARSVSIGGYGNLAGVGSYSSAVGGQENLAEASYSSTIGGFRSHARLFGQHAYASGSFAANGDAQGSRLVARNTTSGTTPADLFLDGTDDRLVLPASTSWGFTISVVGRTTDAGTGVEQSAYYKLEGLIKRDGASNTTLVGSVTKTVLAEDDATWDVTVSADDTNEALDISCTGGSGDNTRWVATVTLTEVGG